MRSATLTISCVRRGSAAVQGDTRAIFCAGCQILEGAARDAFWAGMKHIIHDLNDWAGHDAGRRSPGAAGV